MTGAAKWLRFLEIASIVAGISLLGGAFAATVHRWHYQARQERALSRIDAVGVPPSATSATVPLGSHEILDPLALGRIEIPRIGVKAIVREGSDEATLALAVARDLLSVPLHRARAKPIHRPGSAGGLGLEQAPSTKG